MRILIFYSFRLNNLYTEIKTERAIYYVLLVLKSKVLENEALFFHNCYKFVKKRKNLYHRLNLVYSQAAQAPAVR